MIKTKKITKYYGERCVVKEIDIEVRRGEVVGLLGPNGAGKTTTFYIITGMIKPDSGGVYIDDQEISGLPMYKRARLGIGYLPQQPSIFRGLSVEDNILSILETKKYHSDQKQTILEDLLTEFSLTHLRRAMPYMLSGGERRRTEIARCLCSNPNFILMERRSAVSVTATRKPAPRICETHAPQQPHDGDL